MHFCSQLLGTGDSEKSILLALKGWPIEVFSVFLGLRVIVRKVKVVPYTFVRRGVPVREDTYAEPSAYDVGWPVPFLAAFISPVYPLGTHLLLGEQ